jgi:hypothetical protein
MTFKLGDLLYDTKRINLQSTENHTYLSRMIDNIQEHLLPMETDIF